MGQRATNEDALVHYARAARLAAGSGDTPGQLTALGKVEEVLRLLKGETVARARFEGMSWRSIGAELGQPWQTVHRNAGWLPPNFAANDPGAN